MCKCVGAKFQIVPSFPSLVGQVSADSPRITREGQTDKQTIRRGPNRLRATDDAASLPRLRLMRTQATNSLLRRRPAVSIRPHALPYFHLKRRPQSVQGGWVTNANHVESGNIRNNVRSPGQSVFPRRPLKW